MATSANVKTCGQPTPIPNTSSVSCQWFQHEGDYMPKFRQLKWKEVDPGMLWRGKIGTLHIVSILHLSNKYRIDFQLLKAKTEDRHRFEHFTLREAQHEAQKMMEMRVSYLFEDREVILKANSHLQKWVVSFQCGPNDIIRHVLIVTYSVDIGSFYTLDSFKKAVEERFPGMKPWAIYDAITVKMNRTWVQKVCIDECPDKEPRYHCTFSSDNHPYCIRTKNGQPLRLVKTKIDESEPEAWKSRTIPK